MNKKVLRPEVAEHFELIGVQSPVSFVPGFGEIDFSKLTLETARMYHQLGMSCIAAINAFQGVAAAIEQVKKAGRKRKA